MYAVQNMGKNMSLLLDERAQFTPAHAIQFSMPGKYAALCDAPLKLTLVKLNCVLKSK
jgi:hypothetical protein